MTAHEWPSQPVDPRACPACGAGTEGLCAACAAKGQTVPDEQRGVDLRPYYREGVL